MTNRMQKGIFFLFISVAIIYSCSKDSTILVDPDSEVVVEDEEIVDETQTEESPESENTTVMPPTAETPPVDNPAPESPIGETPCNNAADFVFNEKDGLVLVEFEKTNFSGNWKLKNAGNQHTGEGYLVWEGAQYFNTPGNGILTYNIKIENPGTYQFMWHTAITLGNDGTEHNDTWLRFDDADDYYGVKVNGTSVVYPAGRGKSPNPKGASSDGWFKVYRSGNLDYKWQALTSDHDAHAIFVEFDSPGTYLMEVSARSTGHAIDKFVLFRTNMNAGSATGSQTFSVISCN
ncbi:MAG: hypothetical protein ACFCUL_00510 [Flavobacteriaceae bacterium]